MGSREDRIAQNESLFRGVNEGIARAAVAHGRADGELPFVCECPALQCGQVLHLTLAQYAVVREHPAHFLVARGHEVEEVEKVIGEHRNYLVVHKMQLDADHADQED